MPDPTGVESHIQRQHRGVSWKQPVRVATTGTITISTALNAGDSIDGVTLAAGDRVLVKDQSTGSQNGIYKAGVTPIRDYDMDQDGTTTVPAEEIAGAFVYVIAGTANAGKVFHTSNVAGGTLGSTTITWVELSAAGGITVQDEGTPLTTAATTLNFVGSGVTATGAGATKTITIPGGGAPSTVDYLVGTADAGLSAEIVVGTTPGGELGNTWASPTVDATHSGSAHTDFIAKSVANAKGDLFTATANDTPAVLTVGANDTVLMADSAQTTGQKWVASQTPTTAVFADTAAEGTADTYARGDHKHGMPNAPAPGTDAEGFTVILSTANEDATNVAGATQDHTQLQFSVTAGKHYMVQLMLVISGSDATGDFAYRMAVAAGTMDGRGVGTNLNTTGPSAEVLGMAAVAAANTGSVPVGTPADVTYPEHVTMFWAVKPSNTTTCKLQFGNNSAGVGRISRVWAGSILKWKQID